MDDDAFRENFERAAEDVGVLRKAQRFKFSRLVSVGEIGIFENVQQLQLDAVGDFADIAHAVEHFIDGFSGQTEDEVGDDLDADRVQPADRFIINRKVVSAADIGGCGGVDRL